MAGILLDIFIWLGAIACAFSLALLLLLAAVAVTERCVRWYDRRHPVGKREWLIPRDGQVVDLAAVRAERGNGTRPAA